MSLPQDYRPHIHAAEAKDHDDPAVRADLIVEAMTLIDHLSGVEQAEACGLPADMVPGRQGTGRSCPLSTDDLRRLLDRLRARPRP